MTCAAEYGRKYAEIASESNYGHDVVRHLKLRQEESAVLPRNICSAPFFSKEGGWKVVQDFKMSACMFANCTAPQKFYLLDTTVGWFSTCCYCPELKNFFFLFYDCRIDYTFRIFYSSAHYLRLSRCSLAMSILDQEVPFSFHATVQPSVQCIMWVGFLCFVFISSTN